MTKRCTVRFPVVEGGTGLVQLVTVEAVAMPVENPDRFCAGHGRVDALNMLREARVHETPERRSDGVLLHFDAASDFQGRSCALALGIVDKLLRYAEAPVPRTDIIATGDLPRGQRGKVARIDDFDRKVRAIVVASQAAADPLVFVFPNANRQDLSAEALAGLDDEVRAGRLKLVGVDHLSDARWLWSGRPGLSSRALTIAGIAATLIVAIAIGSMGVLAQRPRNRCEDAFAALKSNQSPEYVRRAVTVCAAAAEQVPQDGRVRFLAGQAYAINGGGPLAWSEWEAAADLGDPDGLASWGRRLWLSAPDDPKVVAKAIGYLERGAASGSAAAAKTLGDVYGDGQALPIDAGKAAANYRLADRLREGKKL